MKPGSYRVALWCTRVQSRPATLIVGDGTGAARIVSIVTAAVVGWRGSCYFHLCRAGVAEWQTRRTQNPLPARACGFDSLLRHQIVPHKHWRFRVLARPATDQATQPVEWIPGHRLFQSGNADLFFFNRTNVEKLFDRQLFFLISSVKS